MIDENALEPSQTGGEGSQEVTGGFLQSIMDIFIDPGKVFKRIDTGLTWWKPFILVSVVSMIIGWLMLPMRRRLLELNVTGMPEEQLEQALQGMDRFGVIGLIAVPILLVIVLLIIAGIAHLFISFVSSDANFKKTLSLTSYTNLIPMLGQIIMVIVLRMKGIESVESTADLQLSFSLAPLFPELAGFLKAFVESLGLFNIWFYIIFLLGIAAIFKVERSKALVPVIPIWLLTIVLTYLQTLGGGMR
ncbi:MAG: YIP1 family protein [bacterium]|nr:MAG: YIP1 family protein [bacterium]